MPVSTFVTSPHLLVSDIVISFSLRYLTLNVQTASPIFLRSGLGCMILAMVTTTAGKTASSA